MQPIEGITPQALWTFLVVAVGLCALVVLGDKVADVFRRGRERKQAQRPELADEISAKVIQKLKPQFEEIDRKLANDNTRLDLHDRQISALSERQSSAETGIKALSRGVLALLNHQLHNGNTDELNDAQKALNNYLIEK